MLYYFNNKCYLLVSGYYREAKVEKNNKGEFVVKVDRKAKKIEKTAEYKPQITLEEAYKKQNVLGSKTNSITE